MGPPNYSRITISIIHQHLAILTRTDGNYGPLTPRGSGMKAEDKDPFPYHFSNDSVLRIKDKILISAAQGRGSSPR